MRKCQIYFLFAGFKISLAYSTAAKKKKNPWARYLMLSWKKYVGCIVYRHRVSFEISNIILMHLKCRFKCNISLVLKYIRQNEVVWFPVLKKKERQVFLRRATNQEKSWAFLVIKENLFFSIDLNFEYFYSLRIPLK